MRSEKPETRTTQLNFRTTTKIKKMLRELSKQDHRNMTMEVEYLIFLRYEELKKGE